MKKIIKLFIVVLMVFGFKNILLDNSNVDNLVSSIVDTSEYKVIKKDTNKNYSGARTSKGSK